MNKKYTPPYSAAITLSLLTIITFTSLFTAASKIFNKQILYTITAVLTAIAITFLIYIPLWLKNIAVYIDQNTVILRSGIIISTERRINRASIELAYIIKTPFSKHTGISFTVLCVYGKKIILPLISVKDAEEILDIICCNTTKRKDQSYEA